MKKYAVLIDGGFLRDVFGKQAPLDVGHIESFIASVRAEMSGHDLHRIYFYDAKPLTTTVKNPLGGEVDFSASTLSKNNSKLFSELRDVDFVALRMGELVFRGWYVPHHKLSGGAGNAISISSKDLVPDVKQKGVDMRIGLDIAALVLKSHVDVIILVTADADVVPAMKFARREGAQVFLVHMRHRVHASMIEHADRILDIGRPAQN